MGDKITKLPHIRFSGFTDAWEQRKLGDIISLYGGNAFSSIDSVQDGVRWLKIANVGIGQLKWGEESFLPVSYLDEYPSYRLKIGDYVMALTRPILNKELKIAEITEENILLNQRVARLIFTGDEKFGYQLMRKQSTVEMIENELAGTDPPNLSGNTLNHIDVRIPNLVEQKKIGKYFSSLDNLITLHQHKLELMKLIKKSMIQKMIPKDGENVPEIRFTGFNDAWEHRELYNYIETSKVKNSDNKYTKSDVLSVSGQVGVVNQIEFQGRSFAGVSVTNYGVVDVGDIVYTKSPLKLNPHGIIKTNKGKPGIVSTLYAVYKAKENTNPNFVHCYFESDHRLNKYLKPLVNKGAKNDMKVSDDNALLGFVMFPSYDEQTKISQFFEVVDSLITLHERELDLLKDLKKSMLQQMFI